MVDETLECTALEMRLASALWDTRQTSRLQENPQHQRKMVKEARSLIDMLKINGLVLEIESDKT